MLHNWISHQVTRSKFELGLIDPWGDSEYVGKTYCMFSPGLLGEIGQIKFLSMGTPYFLPSKRYLLLTHWLTNLLYDTYSLTYILACLLNHWLHTKEMLNAMPSLCLYKLPLETVRAVSLVGLLVGDLFVRCLNPTLSWSILCWIHCCYSFHLWFSHFWYYLARFCWQQALRRHRIYATLVFWNVHV